MITKMFIDGKWVEARTGLTRDILNPSDGQVVAQVAEGDRQDAIDAIRSARRAFDAVPLSFILAAGCRGGRVARPLAASDRGA